MRRPRRWGSLLLVAVGALVSGAAPGASQPCPAEDGVVAPSAGEVVVPDVVSRLAGRWEGEGTLLGRPARFRMAWTRVLEGRFLRLDFASEWVSGDGAAEPVMEATAHYRLGSEGRSALPGSWADVRGAMLALCASPERGALVVAWDAASEAGRTVYRPGADGAVLVVDSVRTAAGWTEFARARYFRAGGP